jgi:hypothetical protein
MKKLLYLLVFVILLGVLFACRTEEDNPLTFTVTFQTGEGGTVIEPQQVQNGGRVTRPADPIREGYMFTGEWKYGNLVWNFNIDIVTTNMTLDAQWIEISSTPTNIQMLDEVFSSVLEWRQTDADLQTFTVSIRPKAGGSFTEIEGSFDINTSQELHIVRFTPDVIPQGGYYDVTIQAGLEVSEASDLLFGGEGTENNPFIVSQVRDVLTILDDSAYSHQHFKQINDILSTLTNPIEINNDRKVVFSGTYNGQNYTLSFTGNGGLFHEITSTGVVSNLVIGSTTNLFAASDNLYPIGAVANMNAGLIENVSSRALLENGRLQGDLPVFTEVDTQDLTTGAGGIVGMNLASGIIRNVTVGGAGAVKAGRGIGGVAAYNFGLIEFANVTATLPAGNQANSANSSNTYSYGGGIAGFNFGIIQNVSVTGRVFAQSAFAEAGNGNEGKNVGFGGIAGYNEGVIRDSSFARSLAAKEFIDKTRSSELGDAANNLGVASVHGDMYVGGIAGINAGTITDVYVGGALIGARDFAGGIAGLTLGQGMITNAYVFAEVAIKDQGGVKVTTPNVKTTLTTYDIAPSGFDGNTVFFKNLLNSQTNETWVPGMIEAPKLPEFTASDLEKVGSRFGNSGVLLWQQGAVTSVDIALESVALPFGTTLQLDYSVTPSNAPDLHTLWTSSDPSIVRILGEGLIEGIGEGTAVITVTTRDGGFTDTITVTVEDYIRVSDVTVSSPEMTLPTPNNITDRPSVFIGTTITFNVELLPENAQFKGYTLSSSNSRAVVEGHQVNFVFGNTGPGNVSIFVSFEDSSVTTLEYRFLTVQETEPEDIPITSVNITSPEITLPVPNNSEVRDDIEIGTVITVLVDILPINATNQNYTLTVSNSRGTVDGNQVSFNALGLISVFVRFEDTSIGNNGEFNFRFTIVEGAPADVPITSVDITSPEITLPVPNNSEVRDDIEIGTVITVLVDILPINATNQNYTLTVSNSRGTVDGNQVSFNALGLISVFVRFEDTSIGNNGEFNFRFTIVEGAPADVPITSVDITSPEITLPSVNNAEDRQAISIGTTITINVDILPIDASNQNYTITVSNSRAVVEGNQVTFVQGSGLGSVSIRVTFQDATLGINGIFEYRFTTINE